MFMFVILAEIRKIQDFWFEQISKTPKNPFPRRSLEVRISRVLLKNADIPRAPLPPGDLAYSRNREIRIPSDRLESGFFIFFGNPFKTRSLGIFAFLTMIEIMKNQLPALLLSAYVTETMPIL